MRVHVLQNLHVAKGQEVKHGLYAVIEKFQQVDQILQFNKDSNKIQQAMEIQMEAVNEARNLIDEEEKKINLFKRTKQPEKRPREPEVAYNPDELSEGVDLLPDKSLSAEDLKALQTLLHGNLLK